MRIHLKLKAALRRCRRQTGAAAALLLALLTPAAAAGAESAAVILAYQRFGEGDISAASIRLDQFAEHLEILTSGNYTVLPLPRVVEALQRGEALPDRTVAITVDDAFLSVYREAWPRLKAANLPWTLFVAPERVEGGYNRYMSLAQLRELQADPLVTIGARGLSHTHLASLPAESARRQVTAGADRLRALLGERPRLFAYSYGEASLELMQEVEKAGFLAAFGQHSGAATAAQNRWYLPRFPITEDYGDAARFRRVADSQGIPLTNWAPADPALNVTAGDNPPAIGFNLPPELAALADSLACYPSNGNLGQEIFRLGPDRLELRYARPFPPGRTRLNCTMPGDDGRWRWYGTQFYAFPPRGE